MARFDSIRFDQKRLARSTALQGLLRGELRRRAALSPSSVADAFAGRPVGVRVARAIAKALGSSIGELVADENSPSEAAVTSAV